jgi:hypothetical protein
MNHLPLRKIIFCVVLTLALPGLVSAEPQTWTLADGTTFEAEFLTVFSSKATFKNLQGKVQKISMDRLSEASRIRIELATPPALDLDIIKVRDNKIFPMGMNAATQRPSEQRCHYGIRIKQTSSNAYKHELFLELFVMGSELKQGRKFILLDQKTTSFFLTEENKRVLELRGDREVVLRNYNYGEKYYGYIAIVKDTRGEIVAMRATHDWLFECRENLRERYVGNFIDKTGIRVFPTRPPFRK